jgi:hypothetical protein
MKWNKNEISEHNTGDNCPVCVEGRKLIICIAAILGALALFAGVFVCLKKHGCSCCGGDEKGCC